MQHKEPYRNAAQGATFTRQGLAFSLFLLICTILVAPGFGAGTFAAQPFELGRVRITGGVFKHKQDIDKEYLLDFMTRERTDRLLAEFRRTAGLEAKAERYPGRWEGGGINGHSLGHYLTALSACWAATGDERAKERVDYIVDELAACQDASGDGYVMTIPQSDVWDKVKSGNFKASAFSIEGWWVPNYTIHKVFAGLRDAWRWTHNAKALEVERKLGDWYAGMIAGLDDEKMQKLLKSEWGGLNETFADLAADTGDMKFLAIAKERFDHREIFEPLRKGEDRLDGKHANTQMPKITGLATIYEMTGDEKERKAVETYWRAVVNDRTLANGGHSDREHFYPMSESVKHLGAQTFETCNINNMHRLSSHLFCWRPDSKIADFVERSLINQLVANIGERPGEFGYFMSTRPVATKVFSTQEGAWWCCVGTGMENPMRYGEQAYFHDDGGLWVNLYLASTLDWREKGVRIEQETLFPDEDTAIVRVRTERPVRFALRLRRPGWCEGMSVSLVSAAAGAASAATEGDWPTANGYIVIDREWQDGDEVKVTLPMKPRIEPLPHSDGKYAAFMFGPKLMVGITPPQKGRGDIAKQRWDDHLAAPAGTSERAMTIVTENLAAATSADLKPHSLEFMPYHKVYEEHYTMYFPVMTPGEWVANAERLEREAAAAAALEARTVDEIYPGEQQSEVNHDYSGANDYAGYWHGSQGRAAAKEGRFAYLVAVDGEKPMELSVTYWLEDMRRPFAIYVDGVALEGVDESQEEPKGKRRRFVERTYRLDPALTRSKKLVKIEFAANKRSGTPAVFHLAARKSEEKHK